MKVRRLPRDAGQSGWDAILPAKDAPCPLDADVTTDWLVIGAGFAGLAAARRVALARPGERIVVLDAVRIGEGPAGRNSGFMIDLPHHLTSGSYAGAVEADRAEIAANRAAIDFALTAAADYGMPPEAILLAGKINAAATARGMAHNRAYGAHLSRMGEPHEMLDAAAMRALTGSGHYLGGLYTPGTAMLQPALFGWLMAAGLRAQGIAIHEATPVTALAREGADWRAVTPSGSVTAPRVVLAVNGHAESFGHFRRRLVHVILYASMTRALTADEVRALGGDPCWGLTPADPMGSTVRRVSGTGGDRIVVRNRTTYAPTMEVPDDAIARMGQAHDRTFRARFPALPGVAMEHRWSGRLCLSLNDAPAFGEVEPGLFAACCQNGLGAARGTLAGMAAADLAMGIENDLTGRMTGGPAPRRLPPEPIAAWGATARIRWGEYRAGAEL